MRFLLPTLGSLGDLRPFLSIAAALTRAGHRATIATHASFAAEVRRLGIDFHTLRPDWHAPSAPPERSALAPRSASNLRGVATLLERWLLPYTDATAGDLLDAVARHDAMLVHPLVLPAPAVAEFSGTPWLDAVLSPWNLAPTRYERISSLVGEVSHTTIRDRLRPLAAPLDALQRRFGLPDRGHPLFEAKRSPFGTLALFSQSFAAREPDWPESLSQAGFPFLDDGEDLPPEVERFLDAGEPPLLFTRGTAASDGERDFFQRAAQVCDALGQRGLFVTTRVGDAFDGVAASRSIFTCTRLPFAPLFPRVAAVVHHGGIGTTADALRAARPTLVVPHTDDQPDNAVRARRLGVARWIARSRFDVPRATIELERLLSNESYRDAAGKVATLLATEDGARAAADALVRVALGETLRVSER